METINPTAQFALVREIGMRSQNNRKIKLTETSTSFEAEPALFDLVTQASKAWPGKWRSASLRTRPLFPAPRGETPQSGTEYVRRVNAMFQQARMAGILDEERLMQPPVGWPPVVERAVFGLSALMQHPRERPAAIRVIQLKEKFGTMRLCIDVLGSRNVRGTAVQIARWAELCSENRCILTGQPGKLRRGAWMLTLSDEAEKIHQANHAAFSRCLYPNPR